jgi:hypothetical protein
MPTCFSTTEEDLQSRFPDRRPCSHGLFAQLPTDKQLLQEAEQDGAFFLIYRVCTLQSYSSPAAESDFQARWNARCAGTTIPIARIMVQEFDTAGHRAKEIAKIVTLFIARRAAATIANIPHRTGPSLRERTQRRKWGKRRGDQGGDGDSPATSPIHPGPPIRPRKEANHPPQPESETR